MPTIDDLRKRGYTVGIAHGSVEVEEQALAEAKAAADPNVVGAQVNDVVADTVKTLGNLGMIPDDPAERHELFAKMGDSAFEMLTAGRSERVAFHERALQIARESPDVWRVEQTVATATGEVTVASLLVATKADGSGWDDESQAVLDSLADPVHYAEREWQAQNTDAMQAAQQLQAAGATVEREPGETGFTVDGKPMTVKQLVAAAERG